jgi:hypothetical protein
VRDEVGEVGLLMLVLIGDVVSIVTSSLSTATPGPAELVDELTTDPA